MRADHISSRGLGWSSDAYPTPSHHEPRPRASERDWPGEPPADLVLALEAGLSPYGAVTRALGAAGWSADKVSILGDMVVTQQGPGMYYVGVIEGDQVRLVLWES